MTIVNLNHYHIFVPYLTNITFYNSNDIITSYMINASSLKECMIEECVMVGRENVNKMMRLCK